MLGNTAEEIKNLFKIIAGIFGVGAILALPFMILAAPIVFIINLFKKD